MSRSWKMLSPLVARQAELTSAMQEIADPQGGGGLPQVFTNAPGPQYLGTYTPYEASRDFPDEVRALISAAAGEEVHRSLLLEKSRTVNEDAEAYAAKERWAAGIQRMADFLKENRRRDSKLQALAVGMLLSDLQDELSAAAVRASLSLEVFRRLTVEDLLLVFDGKPFLSVLLRLFERRLRNPNDPWKPNDLNDMQFLGLAAAYADCVVGERHFLRLLADIRPKAHVRAKLYTNLAECMAELPLAAG
ncbi:MAG: hypothetical protein H0U86_09780 [Chloroflexi bacterium]|nr:hypothetical protein [Chloroflexota bacterium]